MIITLLMEWGAKEYDLPIYPPQWFVFKYQEFTPVCLNSVTNNKGGG